jgi:hypothetical protein
MGYLGGRFIGDANIRLILPLQFFQQVIEQPPAGSLIVRDMHWLMKK